MKRLNTSWYSEVSEEVDTRSKFDLWLEGELAYEELPSADKKRADRLIGKQKKSVEELTSNLHDILEELNRLNGAGER